MRVGRGSASASAVVDCRVRNGKCMVAWTPINVFQQIDILARSSDPMCQRNTYEYQKTAIIMCFFTCTLKAKDHAYKRLTPSPENQDTNIAKMRSLSARAMADKLRYQDPDPGCREWEGSALRSFAARVWKSAGGARSWLGCFVGKGFCGCLVEITLRTSQAYDCGRIPMCCKMKCESQHLSIRTK